MPFSIIDEPFHRSKTAYRRFSGIGSGYRYYSPEMGRWGSRDPIEERGGLNIYGFVVNNPIDKWDLFGLTQAACDVCCDYCEMRGDWRIGDNGTSQLTIRTVVTEMPEFYSHYLDGRVEQNGSCCQLDDFWWETCYEKGCQRGLNNLN